MSPVNVIGNNESFLSGCFSVASSVKKYHSESLQRDFDLPGSFKGVYLWVSTWNYERSQVGTSCLHGPPDLWASSQSPSGNTVHFLSHWTVSQKPPCFSNRWASRRYLDPGDKGRKSFLFVDKCSRAMQGRCQWGAAWNGDVGTQINKHGVQRTGGSLGKWRGSPSRERLKSIIWILKAVVQSSRQCGHCCICLHCPRELSPLLSHTCAEGTDGSTSHHRTRPCTYGLSPEPGRENSNWPHLGLLRSRPRAWVWTSPFSSPVTPAQPQSLTMGWVQGRFAGCLAQIWVLAWQSSSQFGGCSNAWHSENEPARPSASKRQLSPPAPWTWHGLRRQLTCPPTHGRGGDVPRPSR